MLEMLGRLERHAGSKKPGELYQAMLSAQWTPTTPAKAKYIRWTYSGSRRDVSVYQNSADLVVASNKLVDLVLELPGAQHRMPKNEVNFRYRNEVQQALRAVEVVQRHADGSDDS